MRELIRIELECLLPNYFLARWLGKWQLQQSASFLISGRASPRGLWLYVEIGLRCLNFCHVRVFLLFVGTAVEKTGLRHGG